MKISIDLIKFNENNPRTISEEQFKLLKRSIKDFPEMLELRPIILDKNNTVIAGNMRLKALRELKYQEVEVIKAEDLSQTQIKEFIIKDNISYGDWNWDMLANEWNLEELKQWGMDISGYENEISIDEDDFKIPEFIETDIKPGDLFEIGPHRLLCGDSINLDHVKKLMNGNKAAIVWTDPPYNVSYKGRGEKTSNNILNDNMSMEDFEVFLRYVFQVYKVITKPNTPFYICHASSSQAAFEQAMAMAGLEIKNQIIWSKNNASIGWGDYNWKHEPIFYASYGKKKVPFYGGRSETTVWTVKKEMDYQHPTQKPLELIAIALRNSSSKNDIVTDLFGGSGSTMVTCEKMKRICYCMELDPKHCQGIVDRMIALNPDQPVLRNGKKIITTKI